VTYFKVQPCGQIEGDLVMITEVAGAECSLR
jgi:hypothetical protein